MLKQMLWLMLTAAFYCWCYFNSSLPIQPRWVKQTMIVVAAAVAGFIVLVLP